MPHQCLKCGQIFEDGSPQLLKGCSNCGGNKFFFTKEPLNDEERNVVAQEVGKDIDSTIIEILGKENEHIVNKSGKWVTIKPKDVRKALEQHLSEKEKATNNEKVEIISDERRKEILEKLDSKESTDPETIHVEQPGRYNIDLKGLLEEEPIIIQKDGTYTIHLPSIFKMIDKEKK